MYQHGLSLTLTNWSLEIPWKKNNSLTEKYVIQNTKRTYLHTQEMNHHRSMLLRQ